MSQETMLQYVVRKINDRAYNCAELARKTGIRKSTISEIGSGKNTDPQHSTVERIYQYFKALAD
jgi:predicted transcriptional regulator